jgi:hypothetical protein
MKLLIIMRFSLSCLRGPDIFLSTPFPYTLNPYSSLGVKNKIHIHIQQQLQWQNIFFLTEVKIKITLLWDVTPCSLIEWYECFGRTYCRFYPEYVGSRSLQSVVTFRLGANGATSHRHRWLPPVAKYDH